MAVGSLAARPFTRYVEGGRKSTALHRVVILCFTASRWRKLQSSNMEALPLSKI